MGAGVEVLHARLQDTLEDLQVNEKEIGFMPSIAARTTKIISSVIVAALAITPVHSNPQPVRYACPASEDLSVERSRSAAHVKLGERTYDLQRQRSSIGDKYVSSRAALIIDGRSAIFVAEDLIDLGTCTRAVPIASAH